MRPLEPRDPGKVGIYACGPTVYGRIHVGNARPFVVFSQLKRFLEHEGFERRRSWPTSPTSTTRSTTRRAQPGVRSDELAARDDGRTTSPTPTRLGLGRPDHEPLAIGDDRAIIDLIEALIDARPRLRGRRRRLLPRALATPATASCRTATSTRWTRARASRAPTARRTRSTSRSGRAQKPGEDTSWDVALGPRPPGWHIECSAMAEKLLGVASTSTAAARPRCSRTTRTRRPRPRPARGEPLARIWMHNGMLELGAARRCPSRSATSRSLREALDDVGRDTLLCTSPAATTASRSRSRRRLEEAAARVRALPRRRRAGSSRPVARGPGAAARRVLRRAGRRLQHARGARRGCRVDQRGQPAATDRRRRRPARDARRARARQPARRATTGRRGARGLAQRARARRATATSPRPTACATSCVTPAGRSATARTAPELVPAAGDGRVIVYGRNPVREALRGPPPGRGAIWATTSAAPRRSGSAARAVPRRGRDGRGDRRARCGSRRPSGRLRGGRPVPATRTPPSCWPAPDPLLVALDEVTDPQNLGAVAPHGRVRRGDRAWSSPSAARAEVTPAVCKASAGAVEHLRRPRAQPRRLPRRRQGGGRWPTAPPPRRAPRTTAGLPRGGRPGARRGGARAAPAGRGRLRRPRLAAGARADRVAQRQRRRGGSAVRDLAARLDTLDISVQMLAPTSTRLEARGLRRRTHSKLCSTAPGEVVRHEQSRPASGRKGLCSWLRLSAQASRLNFRLMMAT